MSRILQRALFCLLVAATAQNAIAADIPLKLPYYKALAPPSIFSWTGCYVGGSAGGDWTSGHNVPITFIDGGSGATASCSRGRNSDPFQYQRIKLDCWRPIRLRLPRLVTGG